MSNYIDLKRLVKLADDREPSDIFLKVGKPPLVKIKGKILSSGLPELTRNNILLLLHEIELETPPSINIIKEKRLDFEQKHHELDLIYRIKEEERKEKAIRNITGLRINAFWQQENPGMVIRVIDNKQPKIDALSFPPKLKQLLKRTSCSSSGLVLVTGTTGSGKSSTLAAMINHLSGDSNPCHILTIENPIERIYDDQIDSGEVKAVITQREVESDTPSMKSALKAALRQTPNAILIGEIRDKESMSIALEASQTGHLVFSTLHTIGAVETINRVISLLSPEPEENVRKQLAEVLLCIISQKLVRRAYTEYENLAAVEVMVNTQRIRDFITQKEWDRDAAKKIIDIMEKDSEGVGMQTMQKHLKWLVKCDLVEKQEAIRVGYRVPIKSKRQGRS